MKLKPKPFYTNTLEIRSIKMGTRSTTKIYDQWGSHVLSLYKQFDGYHDGWGEELKNFIKRGIFVNGIPLGRIGEIEENCLHNGAGCFGLNLVKEFKDGAGGLYATTEDDEQSYNYKIELEELGEEQGFAIKREFAIKITSDQDKDGDFNEVFVTDDAGKVVT